MNAEQLEQAYKNDVSQYFLNENTVEQALDTLSVQALAGDYVIFLIDAEWYSDLHNARAFVPFNELEGLGFTLPEGAVKYDDCSYFLKSMDFAKFFTCFDSFPDTTLVCVRRMTTAANIKGQKKTKAAYDRHMDYYQTLITFALPEGWGENSNGQ